MPEARSAHSTARKCFTSSPLAPDRARLALVFAVALAACGDEGSDAQYAPNLGSSEEEAECMEPEDELPEGTIFKRAGTLEDVDYWDCERPQDPEGEFHIAAVSGTTATVTGSTADIELEWSGPDDIAGRNLLFWLGSAAETRIRNGLVTRTGSRTGYYRYVIPDDANPLELQFFLDADAHGDDYEINFAIDDMVGDPIAPRIGSAGSQGLYLVEVGSGDVQINLNWDTLVDLDLHVIDPTEFEIYFAALESPSGGMLDLDSYAGCHFENDRGRGNENIFWPVGFAPPGRYFVQVDMWSDCETYRDGVATHYRVTIVSGGEIQTIEDSFDPSVPSSIAEGIHDVAMFEF